jgi:hypothetical protein
MKATQPSRAFELSALEIRILRIVTSIPFWVSIAALRGALFAWLYRDWMNPDGISYLDLASEALRSGPMGLVNAHWSPLYPFLIACWTLLFHPSPVQEFAYVHALTAFGYAAAATCFGFFLHEMILLRWKPNEHPARRGIFVVFGFALFFCYMNADITPFVITPDLLVAADVFAAAGLFVRIVRGNGGRTIYFVLGCMLAVGYYAKSVMLPVGIALLIVLWLSRANIKGVLLAAGVLVLLSAPQILLVSVKVGRPSIGETGRLNQLWWVNQVRQFAGWTGTPGRDVATHPPRILMKHPEVLEFAKPIGGTFPLWYDPAYWYEGAKARFDVRRQIEVIQQNLKFYSRIFDDLRYPLAGLVVLLVIALSTRVAPDWRLLLLLLWPIGILFMYSLVFTEYRYTAPFLVTFWLAAYGAVRLRDRFVEPIVHLVLAAIILMPQTAKFVKDYRQAAHMQGVSEDVIAARALEAMDVANGDGIATVGPAFVDFYTRIARIRVIAQVSDEAGFWQLPPREAEAVEQGLARTGAKVLVGKNRPDTFQKEQWQSIAGTRYSVLKLQ